MASFYDLNVYRKSYSAALDIYRITKEYLPKEEMFGLSSQIRRAATSIPLNIAEGYGKNNGSAELQRYLSITQGSCAEMEVLIHFIKDLGYITDIQYTNLIEKYNEIGKMLQGLRRSVT